MITTFPLQEAYARTTIKTSYPNIHGIVTRLRGCPVFWWIAARRYVYGFFGTNKVQRAAEFTAFLRENGIAYTVATWQGDGVAVDFVL